MRNRKYRLVKWGALICEICMLPMFYSATLLAPIPFGFARISVIVVIAVASFALAYASSSRFKNPAETEPLRFRQVIVKPPFVLWIIVVVVIAFQLGNGLLMLSLANKK
jgi:hypothetical protein